MEYSICKNKVCAAIVTYHPDSKFPVRLKGILEQVDKVVIVDNCSNPMATAMLSQLAMVNSAVHLITNPVNLGIGKALNQAIRWAEEMGYEWVWSFDQDTEVSDGALPQMISGYDSHPNKGIIGIIAPNYFDINGETYFISPDKRAGASIIEMPSVINSGSLISLRVFKEVGDFEEKYFIDCVDYDYCLRMRFQGFKIILLRNVILKHEIGKATKHKLFHKTVVVNNHSGHRRYYWSRNGFSLMFKFIFKNPLLAFEVLMSQTKSIIALFFFEKNRIHKGMFIALGLYDAILRNFSRDFINRAQRGCS